MVIRHKLSLFGCSGYDSEQNVFREVLNYLFYKTEVILKNEDVLLFTNGRFKGNTAN